MSGLLSLVLSQRGLAAPAGTPDDADPAVVVAQMRAAAEPTGPAAVLVALAAQRRAACDGDERLDYVRTIQADCLERAALSLPGGA